MDEIADKSKADILEQYKQMEQRFKLLEQELDEIKKKSAEKCAAHEKASRELELASLIVDQSPAVLFRRKAGDVPTLEYVSKNIAQFGYSAEEFLSGKRMFKDIVHKEDSERVGKEIKAYVEQDVEDYTMYYRILTAAGEVRWIEDQTSVVRGESGEKLHHQGIIVDITERKEAEKTLRKSEEKFRRIVETTGEGFILMDEDLKILDVNDSYCKLVGYSKSELIGITTMDLSADDSKPYIEANREALLALERRDFELDIKTKDGRLVPVLVHGNTLRGDSGRIIGHMAFVTDMTEQKKALALAGEVQKSLLPTKSPVVHGLDVAGRTVSCDEIGGDYFDYITREKDCEKVLNIVVGDISGHGVDSALLMTTARAFLRMRAAQPGSNSEIISEMNNHLALDMIDSSKFMTLFYLTVNSKENSLSWIRAGHDPAIIYDPVSDKFEELKGDGLALGVVDDFQYQEYQKSDIEAGKIIVVGTDGIWEAFNKEGEMFGKDRFQEIIRKNSSLSAEQLVDTVYREVNSFTLGTRAEDDITLVIIKVGNA